MMSAGSPDTAASSLRRSSLAAIGSFMIRSVSFRQEVDSRLGTEKLLLNRFVQDCPDSLECQVLMPEQRRLVADAIHFMQHPKTKRSVYNFFELFQGKGPDALTAFNESMYAVCVRAIPEMHANMAKSARHAAKAYHTCSHFCDIVQSQSCMPLDRRLKGLVMALSFCHDIIQDKKEHNETESLKRFKFYLQEEFKYGKGLAGFDCATVMDAVDAIGTQVLVYGTKLVGMHETISSLANRALSTVAARFPETLTFHDREKEVQLATACMEAVDLHSSAVMYRTVDPNRDLSLADLFKDFSPKVRSIIRKYRLFFIGYAKQSAQMKIELSTGAVGEQLHDMRDRFEKKLFDYMHAEYQGAEEKEAAKLGLLDEMKAAVRGEGIVALLTDNASHDLTWFWRDRSALDAFVHLDTLYEALDSRLALQRSRRCQALFRPARGFLKAGRALKSDVDQLGAGELEEFAVFLIYLAANRGAQITQYNEGGEAIAHAQARLLGSFKRAFPSIREVDVHVPVAAVGSEMYRSIL